MQVKQDHILSASYGLVVCGGNSSRMGTDKSLLIYHEKPQRYHVHEMLEPFCEKVFISCNEEQEGTVGPGYNILTDDASYKNIGPMAALLAAFIKFPGKNILFIGCDYPFLTTADLQQFSINCKEGPVAFYNAKEELYEPLLAWFPYQASGKLKEMFIAKQYSLQHFLRDDKAIKFYPENKDSLISIDTFEDFNKAYNTIKQPISLNRIGT